MAHEKKGGFPWGWAALGLGVLAAFGLASKAKAEQTPLEPYEDPNLDQKGAAQAMVDKLHSLLTGKGFTWTPVYSTATSETEAIQDPTGKRNLVAENQNGYEQFYAFMWQANALLRFNNFVGQYTWPGFIDQYNKAKAYITGL